MGSAVLSRDLRERRDLVPLAGSAESCTDLQKVRDFAKICRFYRNFFNLQEVKYHVIRGKNQLLVAVSALPADPTRVM